MNKGQLQKNVGFHVRLRPPAVATPAFQRDDDWTVQKVEDEKLELLNERTGHVAVMGLDAVKSFTADPARDTASAKYGFLQLTVQVKLRDKNKADIDPLPFGRGDASGPSFDPLVLTDGERERLFSWRGRDAVHHLRDEPPAQLMEFFVPLCNALRNESGREPEFCRPDRPTGDIVYELSSDFHARWPLLGGNGGKAGEAVLVLTNRPAEYRGAHVSAPGVPEPNISWVDLEYPARSGLKARLQAEGYEVSWRRDDKPRNDGATPVIQEEHGLEFVLKVRDPETALTLYKRRR